MRSGSRSDQVLVLDGAGRDLHARHARHVARPDAGGDNDDLAGHSALVGQHAFDAAAVGLEAGDQHVLDDAHAARARALGVSHGQARGLDRAVVGHEHRADDAVGRGQREFVVRFLGRERVKVEIEAARRRRHALELAPALLGGGEPQAADGLPFRRLAGLGLELAVELGAVLHQAGEVALAAQLADQARGMPGRAVRQPALLQHQHVLLAELAQVVGDRAAHRTAADHDDAGLAWKAHARSSPRYQSRKCATLRSRTSENGPGR